MEDSADFIFFQFLDGAFDLEKHTQAHGSQAAHGETAAY